MDDRASEIKSIEIEIEIEMRYGMAERWLGSLKYRLKRSFHDITI